MICIYIYIYIKFPSGIILQGSSTTAASFRLVVAGLLPLTIGSHGAPTRKSPAALGRAGGRGDVEQLHGFLASLGTQMVYGGFIWSNMRKETSGTIWEYVIEDIIKGRDYGKQMGTSYWLAADVGCEDIGSISIYIYIISLYIYIYKYIHYAYDFFCK